MNFLCGWKIEVCQKSLTVKILAYLAKIVINECAPYYAEHMSI